MSYASLATPRVRELNYIIGQMRSQRTRLLDKPKRTKAQQTKLNRLAAQVRKLSAEKNRIMLTLRWNRLAKHVQFRHKTPERYGVYLQRKIARRRAWREVQA